MRMMDERVTTILVFVVVLVLDLDLALALALVYSCVRYSWLGGYTQGRSESEVRPEASADGLPTTKAGKYFRLGSRHRDSILDGLRVRPHWEQIKYESEYAVATEG
jgi:hypothetical protein